MKEKIYLKLAKHLDQLPGGFAPSDTGAELRLLQRLFTLEEARLATHLGLEREEAQIIASRAGLPLAETEATTQRDVQERINFFHSTTGWSQSSTRLCHSLSGSMNSRLTT